MSGAASWLQKQRKSELMILAEKVGLRNFDNLRKSDLEVALDEHMRANHTRLAKHPDLIPFYMRVAPTTSLVKKEIIAIAPSGEEAHRPRARRTTRVRDDMDPTDDSDIEIIKTALDSRTPRTFTSNVRLPPSPTLIADVIDRQTENMRSSMSRVWDRGGITEYAESTRDFLSTVASIESLALIIEAFGLRSEVLPMRYAFTLPAIRALRTSDLPVQIPDLFLLLTSAFWSPFLLWVTTSLLLPLAFGYFFNLTLTAKHSQANRLRTAQAAPFDPLTFNVAKALITWLVYSQGVNVGGLVGEESVLKVNASVPGGYQGVMIGAGIGALTSLYEAVLRK
ncbi:MAG: hypothetical protein M1830_000297 [Pleopsidium flavum]|nr:MAG: hypothetical protein M1830_000297 [Pleopsidium flavum]